MRHMIRLTLALAALTVNHPGVRSSAQEVNGPTAPAATKVGVVNMGTIFQKFFKVELFRQEYDREHNPLKDEEEKLRKNSADWETALSKGRDKEGGMLSVEDMAQGFKTLIDIKRRLQDLKSPYVAEKTSKKTEEQLTQLYREVNDAVKKHAEKHGLHQILAYGEPEKGDFFSFENVTRRMQSLDQGGVVPIYFAPSLDISREVLADLNAGAPGKAAQEVSPVATPVAAQAVTKVGVVDIRKISAGYHKWKFYDLNRVQFCADLEKELKPYRDEAFKLRKLSEDTTAGEELRTQAGDAMKIYHRLSSEACTRQQYREVHDAVKKHAEAHGFHLILAYAEPMEGDPFSFVNVTRKMQTMDQGGTVPIYFPGAADISTEVLTDLNGAGRK